MPKKKKKMEFKENEELKNEKPLEDEGEENITEDDEKDSGEEEKERG